MDFDASKENIQPLRGGRRAEQLEIALNVEKYQETLVEQRKEHEDAIVRYVGDDPLEPWYEYISWIEQSCPKSGKESHLDDVLKTCIETFEKDKRYYQDRRMVKIFIKFIDTHPNPTEFYQGLYSQGIGTMVADLYIAWAYYYDAVDNFKQAETIYRKGLDARAQPLDELENAHRQFGFTMSQRILYKDDPDNQQEFMTSLEERRAALTSLRAHKKKHVGTARTGGVVKAHTPGQVNQENISNNRPAFQVYGGETRETTEAPKMDESIIHRMVSSAREQENTHEPGPWNKAKLGKSGVAISTSSHMSFAVLEDEHQFTPIPYTVKTYDQGIRLPKHFCNKNKPQNTSWDTPNTTEDDLPPKTLPMYSKPFLYPRPGEEYSIEELRGYQWFKAREINNNFVEKYDTIWDENSGIRLPPNFARKNLPQKMDTEDDEEPEHCPEIQLKSCILSMEELYAEVWRKNPRRAEPDDAMDETMTQTNRRVSIHPLQLSEFHRQSLARKSVLPVKERCSMLPELEEEENGIAMMPPPLPAPQFKPRDSILLYKTKTKPEEKEFALKRKAEDETSKPTSKTPCAVDTPEKFKLPAEPKKNFDFAVPKVPAKSAFAIFEDESVAEEAAPCYNLNDTCSTTNFSQFLKASSASTPIQTCKTKKRIEDPKLEPENLSPIENHSSIEAPQQKLSTIMETTEPTSSTGINTKSTISSPESEVETTKTKPPTTGNASLALGFQVYDDKTENIPQISMTPLAPINVSRVPGLVVNESLKPAESFRMESKKFEAIEDELLQSPKMNSMMSFKIPDDEVEPEVKKFSIYEDQTLKSIAPVEVRAEFSGLKDVESTIEESAVTEVRTSKFPVFEDEPKITEAKTSQFAIFEDEPPAAPIEAKTSKFAIFDDEPPIRSPEAVKISSPIPSKTSPFAIFEDEPRNVAEKPIETKSSQFAIFEDEPPQPAAPQTPKFPIFQGESTKDGKVTEMLQNISLHEEVAPTFKLPFQVFQDIQPPKPRISDSDDFLDIFANTPGKEKHTASSRPRSSDTMYTTQALLKMNVNDIMANKESPAQFKQEPSFHIQDELPRYRPIFAEDDQINTLQFKPDQNSTLIAAPPPWIKVPPIVAPTTKSVATPDQTDLSLSYNEEEFMKIAEEQPPSKPKAETKSRPTRVRKSRYSVAPLPPVKEPVIDLSLSIYEDKSQEFTPEEWKDDSCHAETEQYQPNVLNINETNMIIHEHLNDEFVNPFERVLITAFLEKLNFIGYLEELQTCSFKNKMGPLSKGMSIGAGCKEFDVIKTIGKGTYGTVYSGKCKSTGKIYALKQERPANLWEYYICLEIRSRIANSDMFPGFMNIEYGLVANNASILITEFSKYGTLIDVCNKIKRITTRNVDEFVCMFLVSQILQLVDHLHGCEIIHADIKPDNFLLMAPLEYHKKTPPVIQMIDFGVSIDMKLMPTNTIFKLVEEENPCIEMREGKPWTYQVDLYGVAGVAHAMLFGKYIEVEKKSMKWNIKTKFPRYFNKEIWETFFDTLLNIRGCNDLPNLQSLRALFEEELVNKDRFVKDKISEFNLALSN